MAWQTPKTNWAAADVPSPSDFNRIEENTRVVKENLDSHASATTGVHGATSAATPNTLVQRDSAGRFKATAPSASDDVARKAETDAAMAAASNAQATANAALPKAGGTMTGSLKVDGNGGIGAYTWLTISSANNGRAVLSDNSYIDVSTGQLKYKNNHESLGARGIMFDWVDVKYFDTGNVATTANQVFTPTLYKMWHEGNDGAGSGLDADLLDGMQPSTSASANTIVQRDSNGRIKAAAPSASDDVARKAEVDAHATRTDNPHNTTAAQTGALVSVDGVSNPGGNVDLVAGANIAITPNNTNKTVTIAGTGTWPNADMVDGIHFRINNGQLEFFDGGTWKPVGKVASAKYRGSFTTAGTEEVTVLSVSGTGTLLFCGITTPPPGVSATLAIVVDGVEVFRATKTDTAMRPMPDLNILISEDLIPALYSFKSSLSIKAAGNSTTHWLYELI